MSTELLRKPGNSNHSADGRIVGGGTNTSWAIDTSDFRNLPVENCVGRLVEHALTLQASDLFLSCNEADVEVSVRYLGIVHRVASLDLDVGFRCMAHIRATSGMKFAERRHPQDGRWVFRSQSGKVTNLRLSTLPSLYGESFAIRLLERNGPLERLEALGFVGPQLGIVDGLVRSPGGLILVTGPTGSGKTTTLYAFLHHLNDGRRRIHTIEDPIEYGVAGLRQSQVDETNGPTFYELLRGVFRQNPDVIMIGEIRDAITAQTAVRAANSGQLVFATLHSTVAASAIHTLFSLDVPAYFLCTSLLAVISQRLVRTIDHSKARRIDLEQAPRTFEEVKRYLSGNEGRYIFTADDDGGNEGYVGRTGLFEVLTMSKEIRDLISRQSPAATIARTAVENGMLDFRKAGLLKVAQGLTSFEELDRVVPTGDMWIDEQTTVRF